MFKYCTSFLFLQQTKAKEMVCGNMYSRLKKDKIINSVESIDISYTVLFPDA